MKWFILYFHLAALRAMQHDNATVFTRSGPQEQRLLALRALLADMLFLLKVQRCLAIVTDEMHHALYDGRIMGNPYALHTSFMIKIGDGDDLGAPSNQLLRVLREMHKYKCDFHVITILNGLQVKRFFQMADKHNILNTKSTVITLHDNRLLTNDMLYTWSALTSNYILRSRRKRSYSIGTIPYAGLLNGYVYEKRLVDWSMGEKLQMAKIALMDPSYNLKGAIIPVVAISHPPMVVDAAGTGYFGGVEVEIVKVLGKVLNFEPEFYASPDMQAERWGNEQNNGTYTGLLGEMTGHNARIAIGDLHFYQTFVDLMDLTIPHSFECLTFLTPESSQDNSWRTLIQPFSGIMWAGVLFSSLVVGTIFYVISFLHSLLLRSTARTQRSFFTIFRRKQHTKNLQHNATLRMLRHKRFRTHLHRYNVPPKNEDLFDNFVNCILLTYSMLVYVSLPQMPRNWPLRMLTGWYWIYCILLTVTYRASFTAILANPVARITIDTLEDLMDSNIKTAAWHNENKKFFREAHDAVAQHIGEDMLLLDGIDKVPQMIAHHDYAYYDASNFLRFLREAGRNQSNENDEILHIMRDCVVHMPVGLGLEKNSPLRERINVYMQRLIEAGLVDRWLKITIDTLPILERLPKEALMDLNKFWSSLVALCAGYLLAGCALLAEKVHFKYVVCQHPLYDKYNLGLYYNFQRKFPNIPLNK